MTSFRHRFALAALLFAWLASPASATSVLVLELEPLLDRSTAVVEARVGKAETELVGSVPNMHTELHVERVLHGTAPDVVRVRQVRGEVNGVLHAVSGDAQLAEGERVVVFIAKDARGRWHLTAMAQAVFHVEGEGPGARVHRHLHGLILLRRGAEGRLVPARDSLLDGIRTLGALRSAIAGVLKVEP